LFINNTHSYSYRMQQLLFSRYLTDRGSQLLDKAKEHRSIGCVMTLNVALTPFTILLDYY